MSENLNNHKIDTEKLLMFEQLKNKILSIALNPIYAKAITYDDIKLISEVCDENHVKELETSINFVINNSIDLNSKFILNFQNTCLSIFKQLQKFVKDQEDEIENKIRIM